MFKSRLQKFRFAAKRALHLPRVVSLRPRGKPNGYALLSYLTDPFVEPAAMRHFSNRWECRQMAQTFLDLGFGVDVIDWFDRRFVPKRDYRFLIDIGCNLPRLAPLVGENCMKLMHATGKHWMFQNFAESCNGSANCSSAAVSCSKRAGKCRLASRWNWPIALLCSATK